MPISPTNVDKNSVTPSAVDKTNRNFFLLRESGSYLLKEDYGKVILTANSISVSNVSKNSISPTNVSKS